MRFELFLNKLSASQTLSESKRGEAALNCYGMCNPYNARQLDVNDSPRTSLQDLYLAMRTWRTRKEGFGHLVYDPGNSRIYEVDDDGEKHLRDFCTASTFRQFVALFESSATHKAMLRKIQTVCI